MSKNAKENRLNMFQFNSIFLNIFILLLLTIKIKTFSFFKTIPLLNNKYFIITPDNLIFFNNNYNTNDIKVYFNNE